MPKIVDISKDKIVKTAKEYIEKQQFDKLNSRGIAEGLGVATGTIYNYFKSKNEIFACIILEDWNNCLNSLVLQTDINIGIKTIYNSLLEFCGKYLNFFNYIKTTQTDYIAYLNVKHRDMVEFVKSSIISLFNFNNKVYDIDIVEFLAENIVVSTSKNIEYDKIKKIYIKLLGD